MTYLYFPGNGVVNRSELESFSRMFEANGMKFHAHPWAHWEDESLQFDTSRELERLKEHVDPVETEYVLLGKSIGTYFVCEVIKNLNLKPKTIVLMGIPTGTGEEKTSKYGEVLEGLEAKIYVVQNENDPYGPLDEVKKIMDGVNYELITKSADTHIYDYAEEVKELIK